MGFGSQGEGGGERTEASECQRVGEGCTRDGEMTLRNRSSSKNNL